MSVRVRLDRGALAKLEAAKRRALEMTAQAVLSDIVSAQVVPKETGELERSHFVDPTGISWGAVRLIAGGGDVPYGRRLYWNPDYKFRTDKNPHAGGKWLQTYIDGEKKDFAREKFAELFKEQSRGVIK